MIWRIRTGYREGNFASFFIILAFLPTMKGFSSVNNGTRGFMRDSPFQSIKKAIEELQSSKENPKTEEITSWAYKMQRHFSTSQKDRFKKLENHIMNTKSGLVQIHHISKHSLNWNLRVSKNGKVGTTQEYLSKESLFQLRGKIFNPDYFIIENVITCQCLCMDSTGVLYTNNVNVAQKNSECLFSIPPPKYTSDLYTISSVTHSNSSHRFVLGWNPPGVFTGTHLPIVSLEDQRGFSDRVKFMFVPVALTELGNVLEINLILKLYKANKRLFEYCPGVLVKKTPRNKSCDPRAFFLSRNRKFRKKCKRRKIKDCVSKTSSQPNAAKKCAKRLKIRECVVLNKKSPRNKEVPAKDLKKYCVCLLKIRPKSSRNLMVRSREPTCLAYKRI